MIPRVMSRITQNFWNVKWNAFISVLVALAFVFSLSSVAGASPNSAHQMPHMQQMQTVVHSTLQAEATSKQDCDQMALHDDCCEDSGDMPCSDNGGCKTVCFGFSLSSAVLGSVQDLRRFSKSFDLAFHQASYDETSPQLNAPPPRA